MQKKMFRYYFSQGHTLFEKAAATEAFFPPRVMKRDLTSSSVTTPKEKAGLWWKLMMKAKTSAKKYKTNDALFVVVVVVMATEYNRKYTLSRGYGCLWLAMSLPNQMTKYFFIPVKKNYKAYNVS